MIFLEWIIYSLAVWRLSSLVVQEDGPGDIFAKLRNKLGTVYTQDSVEVGVTNISRGIVCLWCVSLWIALPAAAAWELSHDFSVLNSILVWLGLSASAILVDQFMTK